MRVNNESALRRNFVKGALATAAAVGIGGTVLGNNLAKESSAKSKVEPNCCFCTVRGNYVVAYKELEVFPHGGGHCNCGSCLLPGFLFYNYCGINGVASGISSAGAPCSPNRFGLDFWAGGFYSASKKRMSLTYCGKLGIGTDNPSSTLCVVGSVNAASVTAASVTGRGCGVYGISTSGVGVFGASCTFEGVQGYSCCGTGVFGYGKNSGVVGQSGSGPGNQGESFGPLAGKFLNFNCSGDRSAYVQIQNADSTPVGWNAGVSGLCNACKIPDGSFYVGQKGSPRFVVNSKGLIGIGTTTPTTLLDVNGTTFTSKLGVGTATPKTTLSVNGGISAKMAIKTSSYTMTTSDFAILGSAKTAAITITLPAASNAGMMVHIKKIDSSANAVTVKSAGTDKIEGASTYSLPKIYNSVTLVAGGNGSWYVLSNAT